MNTRMKSFFSAVLILSCLAAPCIPAAARAIEQIAGDFGYAPGELLGDAEIVTLTPNENGLAFFAVTPRQPSPLYGSYFLAIMPASKQLVQVIAVQPFADSGEADGFFQARRQELEKRFGPSTSADAGRFTWDQGDASVSLFSQPENQGYFNVVIVYQNDALVDLARRIQTGDFNGYQ